MAQAREHFRAANNTTKAIPWLATLSQYESLGEEPIEHDEVLFKQLENVESILARLGRMHDRKYDIHEKEILDGLSSSDKGPFETSHMLLGETLGFHTGNKEVDGSPDPWWIASNICLVFEDHAGALTNSSIDTKKARQAFSHPNWIKTNINSDPHLQIFPILVTPATKAEEGALPHLETVLLWRLSEFRDWATQALAALRLLRQTFNEPGDLVWRANAAEVFKLNRMDAPALLRYLQSQPAAQNLKSTRNR